MTRLDNRKGSGISGAFFLPFAWDSTKFTGMKNIQHFDSSNGIGSADYLYMTLDRERVPCIADGGFLLWEGGGKSIVLQSRSAELKPELPQGGGTEMMSEKEMLDEMYLNGMGGTLSFPARAFIRVLDAEGKPFPVVFRNWFDALEYAAGSLK